MNILEAMRRGKISTRTMWPALRTLAAAAARRCASTHTTPIQMTRYTPNASLGPVSSRGMSTGATHGGVSVILHGVLPCLGGGVRGLLRPATHTSPSLDAGLARSISTLTVSNSMGRGLMEEFKHGVRWGSTLKKRRTKMNKVRV